MDAKDIFSKLDHTLLKPNATWPEINNICQQGLDYGAATVCIPPSYVQRAAKGYIGLPISTVVGFPLGYNTTAAKVFEASQAANDGAVEIDMVINLGEVKNRAFHQVLAEISAVRQAIPDKILKVIVETCYLDKQEKMELAAIISAAGANYLKTSTGFGPAGANIEDVVFFSKHLERNVKIKAAGGIKTKEAMEELLSAGAHRLGSSHAMQTLFG